MDGLDRRRAIISQRTCQSAVGRQTDRRTSGQVVTSRSETRRPLVMLTTLWPAGTAGAPPILIYGQQVIYTDDNTISSVN